MKEHSILFKPDMVRATLDGRKTQTRRLVTKRTAMCRTCPWDDLDWSTAVIVTQNHLQVLGPDGQRHRVYPRVMAGDLLWVKERWALRSGCDSMAPRQVAPERVGPEPLWYQCDGSCSWPKYEAQKRGGWRNSLFMPRWASRTDLDVVAVRVQWLQDITEDDALAEGIDPASPDARRAFASLWDSINSERASWGLTPPVIVYEYKIREVRTAA